MPGRNSVSRSVSAFRLSKKPSFRWTFSTGCATLEETSNVAFCFFDEFIQISVMVPLGAVDSGEYPLEWLQNHVKRRLELCGDVADTLRIITH